MPTIGDAASLLGAFRAAAHRDPPLPRLVAHLQNATYWDMAEPVDDRTPGEGFITAAVLDIPDGQPVLRLINCGHPPPLVLSDGKVTTLTVADPALPLGLAGGLTEDDYESESFPYRAGDVLLLYTDGVIETRDADGGFYPLADRVATWQETDPDRLVQLLHRDLIAYAGGTMTDDVAVMALERLPQAPA
ncbi:PP2C family protein-serine/threonine phosphatase [Streptomyces telluris]|uniref:PP2C family protein-serine/threonine phosphatase n=1 Tax=Streptomyces telluris TaxID=2720021 RepID=UPI0027E3C417|nr:PP2C family protein-serine/threonine phosphatase [Streptomyces telluris]